MNYTDEINRQSEMAAAYEAVASSHRENGAYLLAAQNQRQGFRDMPANSTRTADKLVAKSERQRHLAEQGVY